MNPPTIVAELSASHQGSLDKAFALVEAAAKAGANAIKLQTMNPDKMVIDRNYVIPDGPWQGRNLHALYQEASTPWEWHQPLFEIAKSHGMDAFSTPFDLEAVKFLESIGCSRYKIASFDIVDTLLIGAAARTGKPMIISTGMATEDEVCAAVRTCMRNNNNDITLLHCVSEYPAKLEHLNLASMPALQRLASFGLSDHSRGSTAAVVATALGATMIERHITLDEGGLDGQFATTPDEFAAMVQAVHQASAALGHSIVRRPFLCELPALRLRKSLHASTDIKAGAIATVDNVAAARPAHGMSPLHLHKIIGKPVTVDIQRGTPLQWEHFK